jgi:predicted CopG family antitoxin
MTKEIDYVELLKLAHEKLGSQSDMIAELEKEKERLTQYYDMWKGQWHELNNRMPIHNIEQQAKGVEGYIDRRKLAGGSYCSTTLMYIDELYEQAKSLKEQQ